MMMVIIAMMVMVMAMLVVVAMLMRMVMAAATVRTVLMRGRLAVLNVQHIALAGRRVMGVLMAMVIMMRIVVMCVAVMLVIMVRMIVVVMSVMVVIMVMTAAAGLAMGVVMMVLMAVGVVPVRLGGFIGTALRLEGRFDHLDGGAKTTRHLLQHVVAGDADAIREKLRRHMAVAEMPGESRQMMRVLRHDLRHRLLGRHHPHDAPIFEREAVTILQPRRLDEVEQKRHVALAAHGDTAAVASVMRQHHTVGGGGGIPAAGGKHSAGTDHGTTPVGRRAVWASFPNP